MRHSSVIQTIGNTPVVELKRYSSNKVKIFAKLEGTNPGGSIKDRIALFMILDAQKKKILSPGKELIEPTSGNTGIGLAMLAAYFGYRFTAVMPECVSMERKKLLEAYGAKIILTDGPKGTRHSIQVAKKLVQENPTYVMLDQFNNPADVLAHYKTTGVEILRDVPELTHFVAGIATGGTIMGTAKRLKQFNKNIQIIGVEPKPVSEIQGLLNLQGDSTDIFDEKKLDHKWQIPDEGFAFDLAKDIFKKEGISVGMSSGAALWGALEAKKQMKQGVIVTIFPDRGDKYLTTKLFA